MLLGDIMVTKNIRLGSTELRLILTLEKEEKTVFNTADAYRILNSTKDSVNTALYRLRKKGKVEEIEKGKYLLVPAKAGYDGKWAEIPFLIVPHLVTPYYIGFASALNYWGMTEQIPSVTFVVITGRKRNLEYGPLKFKFITFAKNRLFGIVEEKIDGEAFKISSREKTIVDCLLYPQYCGGIDEVIKGIWESHDELDFTKLFYYSEKIGVQVVNRRLRYILDMLDIKTNLDDKVSNKIPKGLMWLDPSGPKKVIEYSKEYGLIINRTKKELTGWMGY
jgi:predicted transcriptional regulator of viral defense system